MVGSDGGGDNGSGSSDSGEALVMRDDNDGNGGMVRVVAARVMARCGYVEAMMMIVVV